MILRAGALLTVWLLVQVLQVALGSIGSTPLEFHLLDPASFQTRLGTAFEWAIDNIPFFECSDDEITQTYYFRWAAYRQHIVRDATAGAVVTEFLPPVSWAGPLNTIVLAAGHHIMEGRWLRQPGVIDAYTAFWFCGAGLPRQYTAWLAWAIHERLKVDGREALPAALVPALWDNLAGWHEERFLPDERCFWQTDTLDGGEDSISGTGCRASLNSAMYGEMVATARLARLAGDARGAVALDAYAARFQARILGLLWDTGLQFLAAYKPELPGVAPGPPPPRAPGTRPGPPPPGPRAARAGPPPPGSRPAPAAPPPTGMHGVELPPPSVPSMDLLAPSAHSVMAVAASTHTVRSIAASLGSLKLPVARSFEPLPGSAQSVEAALASPQKFKLPTASANSMEPPTPSFATVARAVLLDELPAGSARSSAAPSPTVQARLAPAPTPGAPHAAPAPLRARRARPSPPAPPAVALDDSMNPLEWQMVCSLSTMCNQGAPPPPSEGGEPGGSQAPPPPPQGRCALVEALVNQSLYRAPPPPWAPPSPASAASPPPPASPPPLEVLDSRVEMESRCADAPEWPPGKRVPVRELLALAAPYYFGLVPPAPGPGQPTFHAMWHQAFDPDGFAAAWGPRTAERRAADYNFTCAHECTWNGPSWPFETSRLLTGLMRLLHDDSAQGHNMTVGHWWTLMTQYVHAHSRSTVDSPSDETGRPVAAHPWIGESLHPDQGFWLTRRTLQRANATDRNREYLYNHSTFADLVITGLVGLRPRRGSCLVVSPLVPPGAGLAYFALDALHYHVAALTVLWDADGSRYGKGAGLQVWANGALLASSPRLERLEAALPHPDPRA